MQHLTSFLMGALFSAGLTVSGMIKPSKVVGFLDFTGAWDPSLGFVMGGALAVFVPAYRLVTKRSRPVVGASFDIPKRNDITWQLVAGASIFGAGWGISGLCPAAAIAALPAFSYNALTVTAGMAIGIFAMRFARRTTSAAASQPMADF